MSSPSHPHAITIEQNPNRVKVSFNGTVIADTTQALVLKEGPLPPAELHPAKRRADVLPAADGPFHSLPIQRRCLIFFSLRQ